jgi:hypothetical protein
MDIHYLMYASRLVTPLSRDALTRLLEQSQRKNAENALTGFLHIEDDIVLQFLEGPPAALQRTVDRIRLDPRHDDFVILSKDMSGQRYFEDWRMALVEATTLSLFDLLDVQARDLPSVQRANPRDLITMLSANASFLRDRPSAF